MNSKLNFLLLIVLGIIIAALMSQNGVVALLTIPILFYVAAGFVLSPRNISLHASRKISSFRCKQSEPVDMVLTIWNSGNTIPYLSVSDPLFTNQTIIEGNPEQSKYLEANQTTEIQYIFRASRGRYSWDKLTVDVGDPFGLFTHEATISAPAILSVFPGPVLIKKLPFHPGRTLRAPGPNLSRLPGHGIDFWGVREYQQGDPLRQINWRLTARHPQQFFSKEFEREEMADVGILVDARAVTNYLCNTESLFEYSIIAASSIAQYQLRVGNRVSLLAFGDHLHRTFPGFGKHQLVKILDQLAACSPAEKDTIDTLQYIPTRLFPGESSIILISPLCPQDLDSIRRFRAEGYQVQVISPNPFRFLLKHSSKPVSNSFAIRTARIEHELLLRKIQQLGVAMTDWYVDQPLEVSLTGRRRR
jgi:uncharacterized protein (DUF58 family)